MQYRKTRKWPTNLFIEPNPKKSLEEIWDYIDGYTYEAQYEQDEAFIKGINFVIPLPPLKYNGKVTKGIFFSQAVDYLVEKFPRIKEIFIPIANSMFTAYPQSEYADAYFVCYKNTLRELYWRNKHPEKNHIVLLPLQDADFTNEYTMAPSFATPKTIDVLSVTTCFPFKNLPMYAEAVKIYEKKYNYRLKVKHILGMGVVKKLEDGSIDYSGLRNDAKEQMNKVLEILGDNAKDYIDFLPYVSYKELPKYYTGAKCFVLPSLAEGKNRTIAEAMCCNTPIVMFKDHNKFARADHECFYGNAGEYAPEFTPESLADTIHKVVTNYQNYEPRKNFLTYFGRKNFVNKLINLIPYFKDNLPDFQVSKGNILNNMWVDLAMQDNYQLSTYDFIYGKNTAIQTIKGPEKIEPIVKFFFSRFGIK